MANSNTPFGFSPVGLLSGAPFSGGVRKYSMAAGDSVAAFIGDPVKLAGTAQTIDGVIYQDVAQAATGDKIVGVMVGVEPATRESTIYRVASTQRIVLVDVNPNTLFEIQEASGGTAFTANDIGLNANFVVGTGSTVTGLSAVELDNSTEATTNTLDVQIVGFANRPGNEVGANAKYLVRINRHQYANQVAGV